MATKTKPTPTGVDDIIALILKIPTDNERHRESVAAWVAGVIDARDARLAEAEDRIELAYNALWDKTADDNTKILMASHYLMNGDPADDNDDE